MISWLQYSQQFIEKDVHILKMVACGFIWISNIDFFLINEMIHEEIWA